MKSVWHVNKIIELPLALTSLKGDWCLRARVTCCGSFYLGAAKVRVSSERLVWFISDSSCVRKI